MLVIPRVGRFGGARSLQKKLFFAWVGGEAADPRENMGFQGMPE